MTSTADLESAAEELQLSRFGPSVAVIALPPTSLPHRSAARDLRHGRLIDAGVSSSAVKSVEGDEVELVVRDAVPFAKDH